MDTKKWGPQGFRFLFCIAANYPVKIDLSNKEHTKIKKSYKILFKVMADTLPCKYCRESYEKYWDEIPIEKYLDSRLGIMYWLYLIKDKINEKLIKQETEKFTRELKKQGKLTSLKLDLLKKKIIFTKKSPPFEKICAFYEKFRAKCSKKSQTCRVPENISKI